jgi:hypothetical protein
VPYVAVLLKQCAVTGTKGWNPFSSATASSSNGRIPDFQSGKLGSIPSEVTSFRLTSASRCAILVQEAKHAQEDNNSKNCNRYPSDSF